MACKVLSSMASTKPSPKVLRAARKARMFSVSGMRSCACGGPFNEAARIHALRLLILLCAPGGEVGKKGGEDAECGKKRADVVHEADARVVGKLAQERGADTA